MTKEGDGVKGCQFEALQKVSTVRILKIKKRKRS